MPPCHESSPTASYFIVYLFSGPKIGAAASRSFVLSSSWMTECGFLASNFPLGQNSLVKYPGSSDKRTKIELLYFRIR